MAKKSKRLKWERVEGGFDLKVTNIDKIDIGSLKKLLMKVEMNYPDYKKPFSKDASKYFRQWFANPSQPLKTAAYCLLSNWFLTDCSARQSTRALFAGNLWDALFCVRPDRRLTDWRISGRKVFSAEFEQWWRRQLRKQINR